MIDRKKKLKYVQLLLLIISFIIIYFAYYNKNESDKNNIISKQIENNLKNPKKEDVANEDTFFDIEYAGLDLNGNRYLLKSEEAIVDKTKPELIHMKAVKANFYFKDSTTLYIESDKGLYNNKTFDMKFEKNVKANYLDSELFAENADYSNSKGNVNIYKNVKINDVSGNLVADKLLFDIASQKLDITSLNENKINANINLNEKKF